MDNGEFVDRSEEMEDFRQVLSSLLSRAYWPDGPRIFEYVGIAGTGKSALFARFRQAADQESVSVLILDFAERPATVAEEDFLHNVLLLWLTDYPDPHDQDELDPASPPLTKSEAQESEQRLDPQILLLGRLIGLLQNRSTIIMIDSLERCSPAFLQYIASEVVVPLIEVQGVLVYLASRREVDWGELAYQIRRRYLRLYRLRPLTLEATADQLEALGADAALAEPVFLVSGGNGLLNLDIVRAIGQISGRVDATSFGDYERRLIEYLHEQYIERVIQIPSELYRSFQVISILRRFDINFPNGFKQAIDAKEWTPADSSKLVETMRDATTNELVRFHSESGDVWYSLEAAVRNILSMHLRFDSPDEYVQLTGYAVDYYDQRFLAERRLIHIREKLYHLADLERMDRSGWDAEIAYRLASTLEADLKLVLAEYFYQGTEGYSQEFTHLSRESRLAQIRSLQQSVRQDRELRHRLGDQRMDSTILDGVFDRILSELESHRRVTLTYFGRSAAPKAKDGEIDFAVTLQFGDKPTVPTWTASLSQKARAIIHERVDKVLNLDDLQKFGRTLWSQLLPREIQDLLDENDSPLVVSTTEPDLPFELLHDGTDFIALRYPLGRLTFGGHASQRIISRRKDRLRVLVLGVAESVASGLALRKLDRVYEEIDGLCELFTDSELVDFDLDRDVLVGEKVQDWNVTERLASAEYHIVHFAGHALLGSAEGALETGGGLVLYDDVWELKNIRQRLRGTPLVFLNACKAGEQPPSHTQYEMTSGIASAFLLGGAIGCIGSVWDVDDVVGARFALAFYQSLLGGPVSVGEALRRAKVKCRTDLPGYTGWAAYVLLGYPDLRVL